MDSENITTKAPPPSSGQGLGPIPNLTQPTTNKRQRPDSDDDIASFATFRTAENFPKFLIIKSEDDEKPITKLSPFVIEKQIEAIIGTPKSVKKLKNQTLLVETNRKSQTDNLLKITKFFNLKVTVTEHKTLNSSKGIIKDRTLRGESETDICDYLKNQGVIAVKRFTIKKDHETIETNTLLLTFNMVTVPKTLKIFYRIIPVDIYVPNPTRCFNCQKLGHHETNCPVDYASVCEKCGTGGFDHVESRCPNPVKCVNCGLNHLSRSNECEMWKKEKEILKIKVTKNITYLEARKEFEQQPEITYSKIVQSAAIRKPETKTTETDFDEKDFNVTASSKVIIPTKYKQNKQAAKSTATTKTSVSTSQLNTSKTNNEKETPRARSKTRTGNRDNSKSPKSRQKEKPTVKLTRVQDQPVKTSNKYNNLESMET